MATVPTLPEVVAYLKVAGLQNLVTARVSDALKAERAAQAVACRVDPYKDDLAQALKRRVHRNLAMQALPLGVLSDAMGATRIGAIDGEVKRLEGPHRRGVFG